MSFDRFTYERECLANGYCFIAGIDEVGRGPLAGPVVASSAMFSSDVIKAGLPNSLTVSYAHLRAHETDS